MAKHPGNIEKHGTSWRVRLCVNGHRYRYTLPDYTKEQAEEFARQKDAELRRRAGKGLPGPMRFSELLTRYREDGMADLSPNSVKTYGVSLDAFETYFVKEGGDPFAHEIGRGHVNAFMTWRRNRTPAGKRRSKPLTARSVAKDRVVLHVLFAFAEQFEIVETNPVSKTEAPEGDQREPLILDADQYEALLAACEGRPMLALYTLVLGETGVRCDSEALWLRWSDVDLERGFLTVESVRKGQRTKSGKSRKVPMTPRLREAMRAHMAAYRMRTYGGKRTEWIFHHELDRRHAKAGARLKSLRRAFAGAVKRAGLPEDLNQHDLRHRRVTEWLRQGHPAHKVQKAMGHSDLRTTLHYEHMVEDDLLSLVEEPTAEDLRELANGG